MAVDAKKRVTAIVLRVMSRRESGGMLEGEKRDKQEKKMPGSITKGAVEEENRICVFEEKRGKPKSEM